MPKSVLHLIPVHLAEQAHYVLPEYLHALVSRIKIWFVEDLRSARRYLKAMNSQIVIDELQFFLLNEHEQHSLQEAKRFFQIGSEIGMISESGCPGVADPGSALVAIAHESGVIVKPHTGPNSILLTLMASGFNGQHFQFHGYLPNKQPMLTQKIVEIERESKQKQVSQFFIEAPYRNDQLIKELCKACHPDTLLCVAVDLTAEQEEIRTMPIRKWREWTSSFHKRPAVFGIFVK
jgi:16S rRNA (cytidine1402-2'-O)-methyltransferase